MCDTMKCVCGGWAISFKIAENIQARALESRKEICIHGHIENMLDFVIAAYLKMR